MAGKRLKINPRFRTKKSGNRNNIGNDDRISKLPDEILVSILSSLPVKEAVRTSVLSPVWINLWKQSSSLNFDPEDTLYKIARRKRLRASERRKYIKWVNLVIESNKATALTDFRICFDLNKSAQNDITPWVEYALSKQVQSLVLDLSPYTEPWDSPDLYVTYAFPEELLNNISSTTANYRTLKSLCLQCVNVSDEAIHFFLSNCPLLEKLKVHDSVGISNLEVCGPSLKHLEVRYCYNLVSVKVSAPCLTFLSVTLLEGGLFLEKVGMLVELKVGCDYYGRAYYRHLRPAISCCISQLETLSLVLGNPQESVEFCNFPEMPKLKKLVIQYDRQTSAESLIALTSLIRASPYLQEFVLSLMWLELSRPDENSVKFEHKHLKAFKFCGYYGRSSDVELVTSFVENCVVLEKITIDPYYTPVSPYAPIPPAKIVAEKNARSHAQQHLVAQVPKHIKLVIL